MVEEVWRRVAFLVLVLDYNAILTEIHAVEEVLVVFFASMLFQLASQALDIAVLAFKDVCDILFIAHDRKRVEDELILCQSTGLVAEKVGNLAQLFVKIERVAS